MIRSMLKRKDGAVDTINALSVDEYEPPRLRFVGRKENHKYIYYADDYVVLDTETSHLEEQCGWVYQWAVYAFGSYIYGRRPSELVTLWRKWEDTYQLGANKRILVYVHNLSYDIQYLKHYCREYDEHTRFFCMNSHDVLIVDMRGIRLCCSYKLTNLSLAALSKDYAVTYEKASGEIDYNIIRYQDSELTSKDWLYMFSDVASQYDGVRGYLNAMGYKRAADAPFTSTGFVRVAGRKKSEQAYWNEDFRLSALDYDQYLLLNQSMIGGQTIASYMTSGDTVENVGHCDFTSSYPCRQLINDFPIGKPFWAGVVESLEQYEQLTSIYCCVAVFRFTELELLPGVTAPYISGSKAMYLKDDLRLNGKIVYASDFVIAITELDYKWIKRQYKWETVSISKVLCFKRGPLPDWMRDLVMELYRNKCTLKGSNPVLYAASKALLNSVYGMTATAIIRDKYIMDDDLVIVSDPEDDGGKQLEQYYRSWKSYLPYQWGVYTTAYARDALHTLIEMIGYENFLYCDTDSVFYKDGPGPREAIEKYNEMLKARAYEKGAYVDEKNILGVATDEGHIKRFKALHAKCYAYEDDDGKLNVTIAGVPKSSIKWIDGEPVRMTSAEELGSLENLQDGFVFRHNGGSRITYLEDLPRVEKINGHLTELASAAIISDIEKEISDTMYSIGADYSILNWDFQQAPVG